MATVLVVEDEFGIVELFDAVLSDEGHRVRTAMNGQQGMRMLAEERPDVMFLDYMMPVMDGAATLRAMAADPGLRSVAVVMMSSMPEATVAERCSGYAAFLAKPFDVTRIIALVEQLSLGDAIQT
ncbi:response regulator (plasmid) [Roseomonas sp. CCTCC AB2023176]|uniref:response regulator n=1 Tax=Roseomonas sp. CCTCC AB2023176 TaxID=3342640 RepID=UPI0035D7D4FF